MQERVPFCVQNPNETFQSVLLHAYLVYVFGSQLQLALACVAH